MKPSVTALKDLHDKLRVGAEWVKTVPNEISGAFFDNPFSESNYNAVVVLGKSYFGEDWEMVENIILDSGWPSKESPITFNGVIKVASFEELREYLIKVCGWVN